MRILPWTQWGIYMHYSPQWMLTMMPQLSLFQPEDSSPTNPLLLASRLSWPSLGTILTSFQVIPSGGAAHPSSSPVEGLLSWSSPVEIGAASALQDIFICQKVRGFSPSLWLPEGSMLFTTQQFNSLGSLIILSIPRTTATVFLGSWDFLSIIK